MLLLVLSFLSLAHAQDSTELVLGGVTYHVIDQENESTRYSNKLSSDGKLILTPTIGYTKQYSLPFDEYASATLFLATDSVGQPAGGALGQWGYVFGNWQTGLVLGVYAQNDWEFHHRGIAPFECAEIGNIGLVPVGGFAVNYRVFMGKNTYIRFNNLISPVITDHTVSIGRNF